MNVPVRIRGTVYPSMKAAARALRASTITIDRALDEGWIDEVGLPHRRGGRPCNPCVYRGNRYPSQHAAAKACGVTQSAVSQALRKRRVA